jgi:pyruvate,water dikinase
VQGRITPDHYEVDKNDFKIVDKKIAEQSIRLVYKKGENLRDFVPEKIRGIQKITDGQIEKIAKIGKKIENHYYFPQDIEWAIEKEKIYIVQTRPITTIGKKEVSKTSNVKQTSLSEAKKLVVGDPACPGIGIGRVKIIQSVKDISKVQSGDILVASMTNPDYVPAMKKAAGIITERGGRTSHAAIVSREFGIPAIVGAVGATKRLSENQIVTVNGATGEVFSGSVAIKIEASSENEKSLKTATNLLVNISEPEIAKKVASLPVDGVGLLRAEFMIAQIGTHPKKLIEEKKERIFIDSLSESLEKICAAFYPRPVLYRATDFKTNEYRNLIGGKQYEPIESNPMLGYRGAYRYMNDSRVFSMELMAIKNVREKKEFTNLNLMIPFVRTVNELRQVKSIISAHGLRRSTLFKLYMMVEIPSNVILIEDFIEEGIDGVSIGSNDLTMLTLGIDRDNEEVANEFDERDKAMLWSYEKVIKAANKYKISSSICGQAPSVFPDLVQKLVEFGVGSISVSPDAVYHTREIIYKAEHNIIK